MEWWMIGWTIIGVLFILAAKGNQWFYEYITDKELDLPYWVQVLIAFGIFCLWPLILVLDLIIVSIIIFYVFCVICYNKMSWTKTQ